jgi:hypothetical protein
MHRIRPHLTYANVIATLALVLAAGGGATAIAISTGKNSVTSKSIKDGQVTAKDLGPIRVVRAQATVPDPASMADTWSSGQVIAHCRHGERVIGGGGAPSLAGNNQIAIYQSQIVGEGWAVGLSQNTGGAVTLTAFALCLRGDPGKPVTDQ